MIKRIVFIIVVSTHFAWAETPEKPYQEVNQQIEEEELIGGIGGTGLYDMERPDMIEIPELDTDVFDRDESLSGSDDVDEVPEMEEP